MMAVTKAALSKLLAIIVLTFVTIWLSRFTSISGELSLIWPVTGMSVAVALVWGRLATVAVGMGMLLWAAYQWLSPSIWPLLFAEATVPGLLAYYWPSRWTLSSNRALSSLANFFLRGLLPGAASAALFGTLAIAASDRYPDFHVLDIAAFYWVTSAIGVLLIAPLLMSVCLQGLHLEQNDRRFLLQWFGCLLPVLLLSVFASPEYRWIAHYLFVPMMVWASLIASPLLLNLLLLGVSVLVISVVRTDFNSEVADNAAMAEVIVQLVIMVLTMQVLSAVSRERQNMLRVLKRQAHYDQLSGLYNEMGLASWLDQQSSGNGTLVILRLEQINNLADLLGLEACERIEKTVAEEFSNWVPGHYARLWRGLYAAALDMPIQQAESTLLRFYQQLDGRAVCNDHSNLLMRPSMVLTSRSSAGSVELRLAVDGLATAANMTGNRFSRLSHPEYAAGNRLENKALQEAIKVGLRDREFVLYAQPIVPLQGHSREPHCEILLRWQNSAGELVSPGDFLPAAEQAGLMGSIDCYVIDNLLLMLQREPMLALQFSKFGINLSGSSLTDPQLPEWICQRVKAAQIDPTLLCFEITESQVISNRPQAVRLLDTLRELGASVALDDFGTGLATFEYLKQFRFDYLKIDGSFIKELSSSAVDQSIVRSMVSVAATLELKTIAEFVEDQATQDLLENFKVDFAQGYHLGRPAPLSSWLKLTQVNHKQSAGG